MALPDRTAVKAYLRIEDDVEDTVIDNFLASALASLMEFCGRPITAAERVFVIESRCALEAFFLPLYPVDADTVEIVDADDVAVEDFRVDEVTGRIIATNGTCFSNFPFTVTADVGLSLMDDFDTRVEPKLSQAFLDLCADWYQRRNPAALAEGAGGGVITQWQSLGIPERICKQLEPYRLAKAH